VRKLTVVGWGWLLLAAPGWAASLDCNKATTEVERAICADPELSKLDEELAAVYKAVLRAAKTREQKKAVRGAQTKWLESRDACEDARCVWDRYEERHFVLSQGKPHEAVRKAYRITRNDSSFPEIVRLCLDFEKNLNEFPVWPPMICERKLSPKFPQFRRPAWRTWSKEEIWERRAILKSIDDKFGMRSVTGAPLADQEWDDRTMNLLESGRITVKEATDIPPGDPPQRWVLYEAGPVLVSDKLYAQWHSCTDGRKYGLLTSDGDRLYPRAANTLLGLQDFLIYRDPEHGEIGVTEQWAMGPPFEDPRVIVEEECIIEYLGKRGTQR